VEEKIVAIIGAGTIGADVALDLSLHSYHVLLKDLSDLALEKAFGKIKNSYRFTKMVKKNELIPPIDKVLKKIELTTHYKNIHKADLVIENITEDYEAKKKLYFELREVCHDNAVYGVNTSCISITKIASLMPNPENVIGMHFMNPVPVSKLVEVVKGHYTSNETLGRAKGLIKKLNKTCVVVNDLPGFVTNRVMMLTINECIWLVQDQVAEPKEIDMIFKLGFGHKTGPLATADLIGLDTILNSIFVLYENYNDPKYRPCPLLRKMVDAGLLGKKSGQGFFKYS
jgi:3-hydroxybutyryl-CoA dehydrogenase